MKKCYLYSLSIIILLISSGCNNIKVSSFFLWMNSYIAIPVGSENAIALTYYYEKGKNEFNLSNVLTLEFENISDGIQISQFAISENDSLNSPEYSSYVITINFNSLEKGMFKTDNILITTEDQKNLKFPIGNWIFDVDVIEDIDANDKYVNTWGSPVVSSDYDVYSYNYEIENPDIKIKKIYIGDENFIINEDGLAATGSIKISEDRKSPVSYIKAKLELTNGKETIIMYDKGCYCGALNTDRSIIDQSKKYNERILKNT